MAMWLHGYVAMWQCDYYFHLRDPLPILSGCTSCRFFRDRTTLICMFSGFVKSLTTILKILHFLAFMLVRVSCIRLRIAHHHARVTLRVGRLFPFCEPLFSIGSRLRYVGLSFLMNFAGVRNTLRWAMLSVRGRTPSSHIV